MPCEVLRVLYGKVLLETWCVELQFVSARDASVLVCVFVVIIGFHVFTTQLLLWLWLLLLLQFAWHRCADCSLLSWHAAAE